MSVRSTLQVRPDWIKKLGMNMPKTIEDIEKVFDAFKNKDPDGNGKNDTIPLVSDGFDNLAQAFAPAFLPDEMEWWVDKNGKLMPPEMHPAYIELLSKLKEWNKKGYIYSEDHIAKIEQKRELMAQNKVGVFTGWWTSICYGGLEILVKSVPDANLEPIVLSTFYGYKENVY